jgi:hypothetical protein
MVASPCEDADSARNMEGALAAKGTTFFDPSEMFETPDCYQPHRPPTVSNGRYRAAPATIGAPGAQHVHGAGQSYQQQYAQ